MRKTWITTAAIAAALTLGVSACGDDQGADVRTLDGGGSASGSASASSSGSASGVAAAEKECAPVGEELAADADTTVDVGLNDYSFDPSEIDVDAGVVTFAVTNEGGEAHELAFLPGGGDVPLTDDGAPDEDALAEMGAFELEAFGPGQDCAATYELEAGDYTMFCIVEAADGETHAEKGMVGALTVG
jgi:plastocyanin